MAATVDPADFDADTVDILRIFLNGLRLATWFVSVGWLLRPVRVIGEAMVDLPDD